MYLQHYFWPTYQKQEANIFEKDVVNKNYSSGDEYDQEKNQFQSKLNRKAKIQNRPEENLIRALFNLIDID